MKKVELKIILSKSGLSRQDFADKLKVSLSTLNSWLYRENVIPDSQALFIKTVFNERKSETGFPILTKAGVDVTLDDIIDFIIQNEDEILEKHKLTRLWLSEKIYKGMARMTIDLEKNKG